MTVGSLFSGIGGFDLAAERLGMRVAWQIESDRFASRVLARHWPDVERHGDICTASPARLRPVDILCGGWPCQDTSIAGKRKGLAGERSGLFSQILRLVDGLDPRPRWLLLENVPGLASVAEGRDFTACVHELRRRGYVGCVRRLDAQYFGLAQRRKRLFFVLGVGDAGRRAVQLVTEGGRRYPAPRRGEGPEVAFSACGTADGAGDARAVSTHAQRWEPSAETYVIGTDNTKANGSYLWKGLAPTLEAGHNRKPAVCYPLDLRNGLRQTEKSDLNRQGLGVGEDGDPANTLSAEQTPAVAFNWQSGGDVRLSCGETPTALQANQVPAVASCLHASYGKQIDCSDRNGGPPNLIAHTLSGNGHDASEDGTGRGAGAVASPSGILRRLTPTEFERLQGFSWLEGGEWQDGHTCLCGLNRGRSVAPPGEQPCRCPDAPRYRTCGNAIPIPPVVWLLAQIAAAESRAAA